VPEEEQQVPYYRSKIRPESNLFRQQGFTGARGLIPGLRESSLSGRILSKKTSPLLPELYRDSDDRPSNPQGLAKTRCSGENGTMGGGTV